MGDQLKKKTLAQCSNPKGHGLHGLFQDDPTSIQRERGLTNWFNKDENYANHALWLSLSPDVNQIEHRWEIWDWQCAQNTN